MVERARVAVCWSPLKPGAPRKAKIVLAPIYQAPGEPLPVLLTSSVP